MISTTGPINICTNCTVRPLAALLEDISELEEEGEKQ